MAIDFDAIRAENIRDYGAKTQYLELISELLYADRTHFILELLQNAEDARARRLRFSLFRDRLELRHDGRPFDERDVRGICAIGESTKKGNFTEIGTFGIGFKSVNAFTAAPEIHSGDVHFRIESYVRPWAVPAQHVPAGETLFVFPFNDPKKLASEDAFAVIGRGLRDLGLRTLLFLRSIESVDWAEEGGEQGAFYRSARDGAAMREVTIAATGSRKAEKERWLLFERAVKRPEGGDPLRVEIAFLRKPSEAGELRIEPVSDTKLSVFFPTKYETHVGFIIQGPYRTTPSRETIPDYDEWNRTLVRETAILVVGSLRSLRAANLLDEKVLEAMPIETARFLPEALLWPVFDAVAKALREEELIPATGDGHVAGSRAKLARSAAFRELLGEAQLASFFGSRERLRWVSPQVTEVRTPELWRYLRSTIGIEDLVPEAFATALRPEFLAAQTDEWMAEFYGFLTDQPALWQRTFRSTGVLRDRPIIRTEDGKHIAAYDVAGAREVFLPPPEPTDLPVVRRAIAAVDKACEFLKAFGLAEPDIVDDVIEKVLPRYLALAKASDDEYAVDRPRIFRGLASSSGSRRAILEQRLQSDIYVWVRAVNGKNDGGRMFKAPKSLYVPSPALVQYFSGDAEAWFIAPGYSEDEIGWLSRLGASREVRVSRRRPFQPGGHVTVEERPWNNRRGMNGFDPECQIDGLDHAVANPTADKAAFIWNELLRPNAQAIRGEVQFCTRKSYDKDVKIEKTLSTMGRVVIHRPWLPARDGTFKMPSELMLADLPPAFQSDEALARALDMGVAAPVPPPAAVADHAAALGLSPELVGLLRGVEAQELQDFLDRLRAKKRSTPQPATEAPAYRDAVAAAFERPGRAAPSEAVHASPGPVAEPTTRRERVAAEITGDQVSEPPARARFERVPTKVWESKDYASRVFLAEQYAGECQICGPMHAFVKRDGSAYFEGVYLVSHKLARWIDRPGNILCLCALCAARFHHGPVEAPDFLDRVSELKLTNEGGTRPLEVAVKLCSEEVLVRFSERHLLDLQELLRAPAPALAAPPG